MHDVDGFHTIPTKAPDTTGQRTAALVTNQLGHRFGSVGITRQAIASHSDPRLQEKKHFAARITAKLNAAAAQSLFTRLTLAGPSRTLQGVEEALDPGARRGVTG